MGPDRVNSDFLDAVGLQPLKVDPGRCSRRLVAGGAAERAGVHGRRPHPGGRRRSDRRLGTVGEGDPRQARRTDRADHQACPVSSSRMRVTPDAAQEDGAARRQDRRGAVHQACSTRPAHCPLASRGKTWEMSSVHAARCWADGDRRSVAQEPERADHDRRLRRPERADGLDGLCQFHRADQHQSGRASICCRSRYWMGDT